MDEYSVLCDGAIRALLDGGVGASDLPAETFTAPAMGEDGGWRSWTPGSDAVAAWAKEGPCSCGYCSAARLSLSRSSIEKGEALEYCDDCGRRGCFCDGPLVLRDARWQLARASWDSDEAVSR